MPTYQNGRVPRELLIQWGEWLWAPGTLRKWLAFREDVHAETGVWLEISPGPNVYRDIDAQRQMRDELGVMAAWPGTSSHGLLWSGQTKAHSGIPNPVNAMQAGAFDVSNWSAIPWETFKRLAEKHGLIVDIVVPTEKWHVVDPDPWEEGFLMALSDNQQQELYDRVTVLWNAQRDADKYGRKGTVTDRFDKALASIVDKLTKTLDRVTVLYDSIRDADKYGRKGTVTARIDEAIENAKRKDG